MGRPVGNILGTAENGSRLVTVGGITYVDNSRAFVDIYDKYGLNPEYVSQLSEWELKNSIREASYPDEYFFEEGNLMAALTGVNTNNSDALTDYLAVDLNVVARYYELPNPVNYDSDYLFKNDLLSSNPQLNIISGVDEIKEFDLENGSTFLEYAQDNFKNGGGFVHRGYKNTVFSVDDIITTSTLGHEMVHVEQDKINPYVRHSTGEYEAYLYGRYIQYLQGTASDNDLAAELLRGIQASTGKTAEELLNGGY